MVGGLCSHGLGMLIILIFLSWKQNACGSDCGGLFTYYGVLLVPECRPCMKVIAVILYFTYIALLSRLPFFFRLLDATVLDQGSNQHPSSSVLALAGKRSTVRFYVHSSSGSSICCYPYILIMLPNSIFVTLLASSSLVSASRDLEKRAFSVRQNTQTGRFRDGPAALRKAYLKHGLDLPEALQKRQLPSGVVSGPQATSTSSIIAVSEQNDLEYLSPVNIGGTMMELDFDTGSSDL
jgi:hypothetical protein